MRLALIVASCALLLAGCADEDLERYSETEQEFITQLEGRADLVKDQREHAVETGYAVCDVFASDLDAAETWSTITSMTEDEYNLEKEKILSTEIIDLSTEVLCPGVESH